MQAPLKCDSGFVIVLRGIPREKPNRVEWALVQMFEASNAIFQVWYWLLSQGFILSGMW
jgi:hypothetical protein